MKVCVLFFLLVIGITELQAQTLVGKTVLELPQSLRQPEAGTKIDLNEARIPSEWWQVYSDRSNNKSTKTPGGTTLEKELNYLDDYYVLEVKDDFFHIVKEDNLPRNGILTATAMDYGWIHKDNLLLWSKCLVTKEGKINRKAMLLNTQEGEKIAATQREKEVKISSYTHPSCDKENKSSFENQFFNVYFVYKIDNVTKAMLLGKDPNLNPPIKSNIIGWVKSSQIVKWDHRVAIEPNWDEDAVRLRKENNVKTSFFVDQENAKLYKDGLQATNLVWENDPLGERPNGDWMRFPVLASKNGIVQSCILNQNINSKSHKINNQNSPKSDPDYGIIAYTAMNTKRNGKDILLFKQVLFFERMELGKLLAKCEQLITATSGGQEREDLKEVWIQLLTAHIGNVDRNQIMKLSMPEISEKVFGLPNSNSFLWKIKLEHITDKSVFPDTEMRAYVNTIQHKYTMLKRIFDADRYEYSFRRNDQPYYWISEDLIP